MFGQLSDVLELSLFLGRAKRKFQHQINIDGEGPWIVFDFEAGIIEYVSAECVPVGGSCPWPKKLEE